MSYPCLLSFDSIAMDCMGGGDDDDKHFKNTLVAVTCAVIRLD